jgi:polysaccharide export outer membrane protein
LARRHAQGGGARTPDGSINFPLVGRVAVAGLDTSAVEKLIAKKLEEFIPDPNVSVVVRDPKGNLVYAQGKVMKPGSVQLAGRRRYCKY